MFTATAIIPPHIVLWRAVGQPPPAKGGRHTGICSHCHTQTSVGSLVRSVVSDKFTDWDRYTQSTNPIWCPACTWAHATADLRTKPWIATTVGGSVASPADLRAELREPLPPTVAVVIPVSRHKHIIPTARWGHVTTDDRHLRWTKREVDRFERLTRLRQLGFTDAALLGPVPRFEQLITLNHHTMNESLTLWRHLDPWREDPIYLKVSLAALRGVR